LNKNEKFAIDMSDAIRQTLNKHKPNMDTLINK
jgi:hypothetical protein